TSASKAAWIVGLSAASILGVWIASRISVRQTRRQHEDFLEDGYAHLHCRNERFVESTEEGLLFGCNCDQVLRSWSQFMASIETDKSFVLYTNFEVLDIPKAAFSGGGEQTEFRALLSQRLTQEKSLTARAIEFSSNAQDWRHASWLLF